jgi:Nitroreductase
MNEVVRSLFERKSVRIFEDRTISDEDKNTILDAALQAPSAGNQTLYTILDIQNQAVKGELARLCDNQPFIAAAKLVLVFVADCRRWLDFYTSAGIEARAPKLGDMLLACEDACIAAQNAVVAAQSLGIGSCYIGDILENREKVVSLLGLDEYLLPATMLVFGYPTPEQIERKKPARFGRQDIVQVDRYSRPDEKGLREMLRRRQAEPTFDFDRFVRAFYARKYASDFALELNRSVAEYFSVFGSPTQL